MINSIDYHTSASGTSRTSGHQNKICHTKAKRNADHNNDNYTDEIFPHFANWKNRVSTIHLDFSIRDVSFADVYKKVDENQCESWWI